MKKDIIEDKIQKSRKSVEFKIADESEMLVMNFQIEWHYKSSKHKQLIFTSDFTDANEALMIVGDLEKTGRTKEIFLLDEQQQKWTVKEAKKLLQEVQTEPHDIVAYFDAEAMSMIRS